jgi:hypothetical protein
MKIADDFPTMYAWPGKFKVVNSTWHVGDLVTYFLPPCGVQGTVAGEKGTLFPRWEIANLL